MDRTHLDARMSVLPPIESGNHAAHQVSAGPQPPGSSELQSAHFGVCSPCLFRLRLSTSNHSLTYACVILNGLNPGLCFVLFGFGLFWFGFKESKREKLPFLPAFLSPAASSRGQPLLSTAAALVPKQGLLPLPCVRRAQHSPGIKKASLPLRCPCPHWP